MSGLRLIFATVFAFGSVKPSLVGSGDLGKANQAIRKVAAEQVAETLRGGITAEALVVQLRAAYRSAADAEFLNGILERNQIPPRNTLRAKTVDVLGNGFRVVLDTGEAVKFEADAKSDGVLVNGKPIVVSGRPLRSVVADLNRILQRSLGVSSPKQLLYTPRRAQAFLPLILFGGAIAVAAANAIYRSKYPYTIAQYLQEKTDQCREEMKDQTPFPKSYTSRQFDELNRENIFDPKTLSPNQDCKSTVTQIVNKTQGKETSAGDLTEACKAGTEFAKCLAEYREQNGGKPQSPAKEQPGEMVR